jgi:hypothetical protein
MIIGSAIERGPKGQAVVETISSTTERLAIPRLAIPVATRAARRTV